MHCLKKEMLKKYREYLYQDEKSQATIGKYIHDVSCFYEYLDGRRIVSKEVVILYKKHLVDRYKAVSVNSMLAALNSFFEYLGWKDCRIKGVKVQKSVFCPVEKELTKKEYARLLEAAKERNEQRLFYIIQTICSTGIRISELQYITVEGLRKGRIEVNGKGKSRRIFVPSGLRKELLKYTAKEGRKTGPVFVTRSGRAVNRSNVWAQMKQLCKMAKVAKEKVFPHNLRHLFAVTFYNMKKDLVRLADILGHTNIETTRIYTISTGKEHEKQISSLGLIRV